MYILEIFQIYAGHRALIGIGESNPEKTISAQEGSKQDKQASTDTKTISLNKLYLVLK